MVQATEVWHRQNYKEGASSTEKAVASVIWSEKRRKENTERQKSAGGRRDTKNFLRPKVPGRQHGASTQC